MDVIQKLEHSQLHRSPGPIRLGAWLRRLLGFPLAALVGAATPADAEGHRAGNVSSLCSQVSTHLLPLKRSRVHYSPEEWFAPSDPPDYLGHDLFFTRFRIGDSPIEFVFVRGTLTKRKADDSGKMLRVPLDLMTLVHFQSRVWVQNNQFSDIDHNATLDADPAVRLLSSIVFYMQHGAEAEAALASPELRRNLNSFGVRNSRLNDWYLCQGCASSVPFARSMAQDIGTLRVASIEGRLYLVTLLPLVVVAEVDDLGHRANYFRCTHTQFTPTRTTDRHP